MNRLQNVVADVISRTSSVPIDKIVPQASLTGLGLSSFDYIECVMAVEDELQVEISESNLWNLKTVQDVINAVTAAEHAKKQAQ